jgi:hypothetical protein
LASSSSSMFCKAYSASRARVARPPPRRHAHRSVLNLQAAALRSLRPPAVRIRVRRRSLVAVPLVSVAQPCSARPSHPRRSPPRVHTSRMSSTQCIAGLVSLLHQRPAMHARFLLHQPAATRQTLLDGLPHAELPSTGRHRSISALLPSYSTSQVAAFGSSRSSTPTSK